MPLRTLYVAIFTATLAACGNSQPPPPPAPAQGRVETRGIRNTDAIGYSGSAIANKVDGALDANDAARKKMEEEAQRQTQADQ